MKCPKCHYIAFDSGDRCKNCGYEFSLSVEPTDSSELSIRDEEPLGPLADLSLQPEDRPKTRRRRTASRIPRTASPTTTESRESDLPLFLDEDSADEAPLVRPSATPRAPLAVRRATPLRVRGTGSTERPARRADEESRIELDEAEDQSPGELPERDSSIRNRDEQELEDGAAAAPATDLRPRATTGDRVVAGAIDLLLIGTIDLGILYFTMRLLALPFAELLTLPLVPLLGFLALLNGGYFVAFTAAGGQTIGKMARHIRVVGRDGQIHLGQAIVRTVGYLLSALPVGLGFVAGALGPDGVALHDRLADTRVVRSQIS